MATNTPRINLVKPDGTDLVDIAVINSNYDKIDSNIASTKIQATKPTTANAGDLWWDSNTGTLYLYYVDANSAQWVAATSDPVNIGVVANQTERDAQYPTPGQGMSVYRTDLGVTQTYFGLYNVSTNPGGKTPAGWYSEEGNIFVSDTAAARTARFASPTEGMVSYLNDTNFLQVRDENGWHSVSGVQAVADATVRDALIPSPNQGDKVFRNDKGYEEQYFALYNASTNIGGATPAGWYPVAGTVPTCQVVKNSTTFTSTSGVWFQLSNTAHWTAIENDPTNVIFYNGNFTANITGWYEIFGGLFFDGGVSPPNGIMIAKRNVTNLGVGGMVATQSWAGGFQWATGQISRQIKLNAGDFIHWQFIANNPMAVGANNNEATYLGMRWLRPAKG